MSQSEDNKVIEESVNEQVEDGKNKNTVKCKFCKSKILDKNAGNFIKKEMKLPLIQQDCKKDGNVQHEEIHEYWHVENMYTFENIGFTHTVDTLKYLSCADCEAGPVGYHDMTTKHSYVAISRVAHI